MHKRRILNKTFFIFMLTITQAWPLELLQKKWAQLWSQAPAPAPKPTLDNIKTRFEKVKAAIDSYAHTRDHLGFQVLKKEDDQEAESIKNNLEVLMEEIRQCAEDQSAELSTMSTTLKSTYEAFIAKETEHDDLNGTPIMVTPPSGGASSPKKSPSDASLSDWV